MMKRAITLFAALTLSFGMSLQAQVVDVKVIQSNTVQCDTSGLSTMSITLVNNGGVPIIGGAPILCTYRVNMAAPVVESIEFITNFNPGDTAVLSWVTPYDFNAYGIYNCMYAIDYLADDTVANDTAYFTHECLVMPGYGAHTNDTSICQGDQAYLMMELTGNGPWSLDIVIGPDTVPGLPAFDPILSTYLSPDSTMNFLLLNMTDVNGCSTAVGLGITITVNYAPAVDLGPDTTFCAGDTLMLDAGNSGATYTWWNGSGSQLHVADTNAWAGVLGPQIAWVDVNLNGCITRDSLTIDWILCGSSLDETANTETSLYPNPSQGLVMINIPQAMHNASFTVTDLQGQLVLYANHGEIPAGQMKADLSTLLPGMYFLQLNDETLVLTSRVIIQ